MLQDNEQPNNQYIQRLLTLERQPCGWVTAFPRLEQESTGTHERLLEMLRLLQN